jgi:hypothetical protein
MNNEEKLITWLTDHLDECPFEWHVQDYYSGKGLSVVFHTENKSTLNQLLNQ